MTVTGGCLCGAVRYRAEGEPDFAGFCHCRDCQRASGTGGVPFLGFAAAAVTVEGGTRRHGVRGDSGSTTVRHSCPTCGSLVFGEPEAAPGMLTLYAGTLDDPSAFRPEIAIYTRSRPAWMRAPDGLMEFEAAAPA